MHDAIIKAPSQNNDYKEMYENCMHEFLVAS